MRKQYEIDITREQFGKIQLILETVRKRTKPRVIELYEVFCRILYVLKTGCQWRMLPSNFPKWQTVYSYFQKWSQQREKGGMSIFEMALKKS